MMFAGTDTDTTACERRLWRGPGLLLLAELGLA